MGKIVPVILSGGVGGRLWPLSRQAFPKQLLSLTGQETLLQQTAQRVRDESGFGDPLVVANAEHRFAVAEQLRAAGIRHARIVLEPTGRGTAPAATIAALLAGQDDPDAVLLLLPTDHHIADPEAFHQSVEEGLQAARRGLFVLFGVAPTSPATGYGYVRMGTPLAEGSCLREVAHFVEKPDLATAERYLASGCYAWNSGIFLLPVRTFLQEMKRFEPEILQSCEDALALAEPDLDFLRLDGVSFSRANHASVDGAIMEKTERAVVVPASFGWSDIGTWSGLWELADKDADGNAVLGEAIVQDSRNCYVRSEGLSLAVLGIRDLVLVATKDAILVAAKERDQDVKRLLDELAAEGHASATRPLRVHRPWGWYQTLDGGEGFQVKRITVNPGAKLSLQKHRHRSEHWVVVGGQGLVTRDGESMLLGEGQSIDLPVGCTHRLENPGRSPLDLIEVQRGDYLGEDDIVRFEDAYARS